MLITVTSGVGTGSTSLAAFDAALREAGIADYNLIPLSSVIPARAIVQRKPFAPRRSSYGDRLYVVIARGETATAGEAAWAGLGWTQELETGRGLFVELHGASRRAVENDISATLQCMKAARPYEYGKDETELAGIECRGSPVCAIAAAVYVSAGWDR